MSLVSFGLVDVMNSFRTDYELAHPPTIVTNQTKRTKRKTTLKKFLLNLENYHILRVGRVKDFST